MRKVTVRKKVNVVIGEALVVDITEGSTDWIDFCVRDTGYPEVAVQDALDEGYKCVAVRNTRQEAKVFEMPLEAFMEAASMWMEENTPYTIEGQIPATETETEA